MIIASVSVENLDSLKTTRILTLAETPFGAVVRKFLHGQWCCVVITIG